MERSPDPSRENVRAAATLAYSFLQPHYGGRNLHETVQNYMRTQILTATRGMDEATSRASIGTCVDYQKYTDFIADKGSLSFSEFSALGQLLAPRARDRVNGLYAPFLEINVKQAQEVARLFAVELDARILRDPRGWLHLMFAAQGFI